ncbi:MAG TPA: hypothetical protein VFC78_06735 [Tepidisphaeraceae bacterium]|nr:hypothetical protein [Tepidisphaeraceae bacterium]
MVNQQGHKVAAAAKSLGVEAAGVRGWAAKLSSEPGVAPAGEGAVVAELQRLPKENTRG